MKKDKRKDGKKKVHSDKFKRNMRFMGIVLVVLLALTAYLWYVVVYRTKVEPKPASEETNTDAALYSLNKQLSVLEPFEEMYRLSFAGRAAEENYGTMIIPGLKSTRTLASDKGGKISICTSMTPQGMCIAQDYLLISAYCHTRTHNSVVYVLDKNTHELIKEIVLKGKIHAGGLAFDTKHHMIWVSTSHKGRAAASAFSLKNMKEYDLDKMQKPIAYTHDYDLYSLEKDSFMTYADGHLYIGHFSQNDISVVQKFKIDANGGLTRKSGAELGMDKEIALPEDIKQIPKMIQGFAVYEDKVILTQSYGIMTSKLLVHNYNDVMYRTQKKYTLNKITMPQKLEQIYIDGTDLYVLFESAAYAYAAQPLPKVDRIIKMSLGDVLKVDIKDLMSEKDAIPEDEDTGIKERIMTDYNVREMAELFTRNMAEKGIESEMDKRVEYMPAGAIVSQEQLDLEDVDSLFYAENISDEVFARMEGESYKEDCTIPREELRYVRVLHMGFDGETHIGELVVNEEIADETVEIFRELYKASYPIEKMMLIDNYDADDEASMADNNSSAFNYRTISNSTTLSNHAKGMAIDINPLYNPYVKTVNGVQTCEPAGGAEYIDRSKDFLYKIDENDLCYQIFTEHGFSWGGAWALSKDYQHFEYIEKK